MGDQVISVRKSGDKANPAAMEDVINKLVATKYPPPAWVRQGPNWATNKETGEAVNLNQEATEILLNNPLREDVIAVVEKDTGEHEVLWVDQTAVVAAGGNLDVVRENLQKVIGGAGMSGKTLMIIGLAGVAVFVVMRRRK